MATIAIEETGCRDCMLCIDICPTDVFEHDDAKSLAKVVREIDCIGCTSCQYICPSRCITVGDTALQRPFFRIEENSAIIAKFLQRKPTTAVLTEADYVEALKDVTVRLGALGDSVTETMGRGGKAAGRKSGALAAIHLPEMYEGKSVPDVLARMNKRFANSFAFEPIVSADESEITMTFPSCAMGKVVTSRGETIGKAVLCNLFHEYWAGLIGAFTGKNYAIEMLEAGSRCVMKLEPRGK